mmetsp:Transcript_62473/g.103942  ORF Transcript_62473/g.103942 Transcript_62473/m.103942 type:complete len:199 (-) Transcript_62473:160-756(-)
MFVVPGQQLGHATEVTAGTGTFVWGQYVHASVAGMSSLDATKYPAVVSTSQHVSLMQQVAMLPAVGDNVTCRISRITSRMANVEILCVDGVALREPCNAILHREDVREFETDKVEMYNCYRPGDVVQARVISLGDSRSYFITTAAIDLGVVFAMSAEGTAMQPISWQEMVCPITNTREPRKVAKPMHLGSSVSDTGSR